MADQAGRMHDESALRDGRAITILDAESLDPSQYRAAVVLLNDYLNWVLTLESFAHEAPAFAHELQERSVIPEEYSRPTGRFLCAFAAREAVGCIALSRHDKRTAEIKRLYVSPRVRSCGLGKSLVKAGVAAARELRYERLILESHISMRAAHRIYLDEGFHAIDAPASYPLHLRGVLLCMERSLTP